MRGKQILKITGSVALSALLAATSALPVTVYAEEDSTTAEKTDTVYSVLNSDGSISDIVVSGWLHNDKGIKNLKEKLNLTDVKNVKTDEKPEDDNGVYTWNSDSNDVYYQGNSTEKLPVSMKITYELDGQEMPESEIVGKSGHLKINIHLTNEHSETRTINDKQVILHPLFVAGGMMTLDTDHVSNVTCEQGKIVSDGSSQMLVFASVPGLKETLDSADLSKVSDKLSVGDDVNIECDVTDYASTELMMGMTNEASTEDVLGDSDSLDDLTSGITELMDADDQLVDGSKQLEQGTQQLITESQPLTSSSDSIRTLSSGAVTLNDGAYRLKAAIAQYTGGVAQLNQGVDSLYAIPDGARAIQSAITTTTSQTQPSLVDGSQQLVDGLNLMLNSLNSTDVSGTVSNMRTLLKTSKDTLTTLSGTLGNDYKTLSSLKAGLDSAQKSLEQVSALKAGLGEIQTGFTNVQAGYNAVIDGDNATIADANEKLQNLKASLQASINALTTTRNELAAVPGNDSQVGEIDQEISDLTTQLNSISSISSLQTLDAGENSALNALFAQLNGAIDSLTEKVNGMSDTVNDAMIAIVGEDGNSGLSHDVKTALATLDGLNTQLGNSTKTITDMQSLIASIQPSVTQLRDGAVAINAGAKQLGEAVGQLETQSKAGIDTVKAATTTLANNNAALNEGISSLQGGTQTIADQSGSFNEMADGLDSLASAFETLHDGAKQLADGQQQFKTEGIDKLKEELDLGTDEIEMLKEIVNAVNDLNKQYREYAGDNENMDVTTRYVFRTQSDDSNKK